MDTPLYDTHCHLTGLKARDPALYAAYAAAARAGSAPKAIDIGVDPGDLERRAPLMAECGVEWFTLGLYPSHAADPGLDAALARLEAQARAPGVPARLVGIGEIGLDFHHDYATPAAQEGLFRAQVELANRLGLPIVIHDREADEAVLAALDRSPAERGGIFHCFASDWGFARRCLDRGFLVSFAGTLTYPNAANLRDCAARLPLDRIVLETDAPYLTPVPLRGRPNSPLNVAHTFDFLCGLRPEPREAVAAALAANVERFLAGRPA